MRQGLGLFVIGIFLGAQIATGGDGPGGVGTTDGTSDVRLWLKADRNLTVSSGTIVTAWGDSSGYGNNAALSTGAPTVSNDSNFNNEPAITFLPTNPDGFKVPDANSLDLTSGFSMFCAIRMTASGNSYGILSKRQSCGNDCNYGYFIQSDTKGRLEFSPGTGFVTSPATNGTTVSEAVVLGSQFNQSTEGVLHHLNGGQNGTSTLTQVMAADSNSIDIGTNGDCGDNMQGSIAEIILVAHDATAAEAALIQTYLMAKYATPLNSNGGIDLYAGDTSGNGDYDFEAAGIAKVSGTMNTVGESAGLIIQNNSFLQNDGDSVVAGHAAGSIGSTSADVPGGTTARWSRIWYMDKRDAGSNGGNLDIRFDLGDAGFSGSPTGGGSYMLLYRAGTSGTFSVVTAASTVSGDQVQFNGVSATSIASGYYTLGTNGGALPAGLSGLHLD